MGGSLGGTDTAAPRKLLRLALNLIKDFEGWSASAYNDAAFYCTIGYGHLVAKAKCQDIDLGTFAQALSEESGLKLLEEDTVYARNSVRRLVKKDLNHEQFGALTSFVFNVGEINFAKSTMLRLLNNGEFKAASTQFDLWISAGGVVFQGLVQRRSCEKSLFNGLLKAKPDGAFNRKACASAGVTPNTDQILDIYKGE